MPIPIPNLNALPNPPAIGAEVVSASGSLGSNWTPTVGMQTRSIAVTVAGVLTVDMAALRRRPPRR